MVKPNHNQQVTDLGVVHKIDGNVVDITDSVMQKQVRLRLERKYEDRKIVAETKAMMRMRLDPEFILDYIRERVHGSDLNEVMPAH